MSYVETVLQPEEHVVYVTRLHWFVYLGAIWLLILAGAALAAAGALGNAADQSLQLAALVIAAAFAALAVIAWLRGALRRRTTELAVTDRRVIFKRGLVRRHTIEMNLSKVESVDVDQSIAGRIFGYGTVTIRGTGGGLEPLSNISQPLTFRNYVTAR